MVITRDHCGVQKGVKNPKMWSPRGLQRGFGIRGLEKSGGFMTVLEKTVKTVKIRVFYHFSVSGQNGQNGPSLLLVF